MEDKKLVRKLREIMQFMKSGGIDSVKAQGVGNYNLHLANKFYGKYGKRQGETVDDVANLAKFFEAHKVLGQKEAMELIEMFQLIK